MRKKVLRASLAIILVASFSSAGLIYWLQSDSFNKWIGAKLSSELEKFNLCLKTDYMRVYPFALQAEAEGVQLTLCEERKPLAVARKIHVKMRLKQLSDLFSGKFDVETVSLVEPHFYVAFDRDGISNFSRIKLPESGGAETINISSAILAISRGEIEYGDQKVGFDGSLDEFTIGAKPGTDSGAVINLRVGKSKLKYQERGFNLNELSARLKLFKERAAVDSLVIDANLGKATFSGELKDWRKLDFDLNVFAKVNLDAASAVFLPKHIIRGEATLRGHYTGKGGDYRFQGDLESINTSALGIRAASLNLKTLDLGPDPKLFLLSGDLRLGGAGYANVPVKSLHSPIRITVESIELPNLEMELYRGKARGSAAIGFSDKIGSFLKAKLESFDIAPVVDSFGSHTSRVEGKISAEADLKWPGLRFASIAGHLKTDFAGNILPAPGQSEQTPLAGKLEGTLGGGRFDISSGNFTSGATRLSVGGSAGMQKLDLRVKFESDDIKESMTIAEHIGLLKPSKSEGDSNADQAEFAFAGRASFEGVVAGSPKSPSVSGNVLVEKILNKQEEIGTISGRIDYSASELSLKEFRFKQTQGGQALIDLRTSLEESGSTTAKLVFNSFRLTQALVQPIRQYALKAQLIPLYKALDNFDGEIEGNVDMSGLPPAGRFLAKEESRKDAAGILKQIDGTLDLTIKNSIEKGSFREAAFRLSVKDDTLDFNRISIVLPSGAIAGTASYNRGTGDYKADLRSDKLDLAALSDAVRQRGIAGVASFQAVGAGNAEHPVFDIVLAAPKLTYGDTVLRQIQLETHAENGVAKVNLKLNYLDQPYDLKGTVKLSGDLPVNAEITFNDRAIEPFLTPFAKFPQNLGISATGVLKLAGPLSAEDGFGISGLKLSANFEKLVFRVKAQEEEVTDYVVSNDGPVIIEGSIASGFAFRKFNFKGEGTSFSATGNLTPGGSSQLSLNGQLNLKLLNSLSKSLYADGIADINASARISSNKQPRIAGLAQLKDVSFRYVGFPLSVQEGKGLIRFTANRASVENFVAKSGNGDVTINGGVNFGDANTTAFRFGIKANEVRLNYPGPVRSLLDGDLVLQGSRDFQLLTGQVNVRRSEYTQDTSLTALLTGNTGIEFAGAADDATPSSLRLNVAIRARDSLIVRNNLADVVGNASLKVTGPINDPIISGEAIVNRGTLLLRGDRYEVTRGLIEFPETRSGKIRLNVAADTDVQGYRVIIEVTGPYDRLKVGLRSEPPLSESDIVALITTGQPPQPGSTNQINQTQTRIATAVSLLTETLSEQVTQRTGKLFGLNRFQLDPLVAGRGKDPTARITLGSRITKNVTLTYSTNVTTGQDQIVIIEYQINRNVSVIGTRDQDGSYGFDVRFRKRF